MEARVNRVGARPENAHQARLLRLLRDGGPPSRAELGEAVELSRSKLAVELDRLTELGLVRGAGLAASRGGRRSHLVELAEALRFAGIDIGATSIDVEITDGELEPSLGARGEPADIRRGPEGRPRSRSCDMLAKLRAEGAYDAAARRRHRRARAGQLPRRRARCRRRSCRAGTASRSARLLGRELGCPVVVDNDVNIMALGERHARRRPQRRRLPVRQDRHRHRLRHRAGRRGLPRAPTAAPATSATSRSTTHGPICTCGNVGCLEALFGGAALARDADRGRPHRRARRRSPSGSAAGRAHRRGRRRGGGRRATPSPIAADPRRRAAGRRGAGRPGQLLQPRPDRDRRRAWPGSATCCSPRSAASSTAGRCRWPPATCPSSCPSSAARAGVVGAARLVTDSVCSTA